jgi:hypothetical protein
MIGPKAGYHSLYYWPHDSIPPQTAGKSTSTLALLLLLLHLHPHHATITPAKDLFAITPTVETPTPFYTVITYPVSIHHNSSPVVPPLPYHHSCLYPLMRSITQGKAARLPRTCFRRKDSRTRTATSRRSLYLNIHLTLSFISSDQE